MSASKGEHVDTIEVTIDAIGDSRLDARDKLCVNRVAQGAKQGLDIAHVTIPCGQPTSHIANGMTISRRRGEYIGDGSKYARPDGASCRVLLRRNNSKPEFEVDTLIILSKKPRLGISVVPTRLHWAIADIQSNLTFLCDPDVCNVGLGKSWT
jgi:hypothetical protein